MQDPTQIFREQLEQIRNQGLYKLERVITTPQGVQINTRESGDVLNFCANNYLGLANHPAIIEAATSALKEYGYGLASVRFICGTQDLHKRLERTIADFLGMDDAILYSSCFDANAGLFETLLGPEDAIISDALNHASIIDGIRLCKARRLRYQHSDMDDLITQLENAKDARIKLIATDGVFSMDGDIARLDRIVQIAERFGAWVMVDDSHATGVLGANGKGSVEHLGVLDRVHIITSTLGKALGGGSGGFTAACQEVVDLLRQRSRPYLFSNTLAPALVSASLKVFELLGDSGQLRQQLKWNTDYFRKGIQEIGFDIKPGQHPIVPIMLYDAKLAQQMASQLLGLGIYVIGFFYPVVAEGQARIRVQICASHTREQLDQALQAFQQVGESLAVKGVGKSA